MNAPNAEQMNTADGQTNGGLDEVLRALSEALTHRLAEMDAPVSDKNSHGIGDHDRENDREDDPSTDNDEEEEEQTTEANGEKSALVAIDDTTVSADDIKRMEHRMARLESNHLKSVQDAIRDALFSDPYLLRTAEECGIAEDQIITRDNKGRMVFYLKASYFQDWKARHQISIGTDFTPHGSPRPYSTKVSRSSSQGMRDRAGQTKTRLDCHCRGVKYEAKGRQRGGKSGKVRLRKPSNKCRCMSHFNAIYQPNPTSDGKPGNIYRVEYCFQHNHRLGGKGNIGTQQKSKAIKERVKAMILRGMSISAIMHQLTMDHAAFTRLMEGDGSQRLSGDQSITYDDVYNILYALTAKQMGKDDDPVKSAKLWMEDLKSQDYFTYYDSDHGLYHGFSSPWQLNELRRWGDVFCFDSTHHASGQDTYLFSIVVKNRETGCGIPVAFFLTKSQQASVLEGWLRQLKAKMDLLCNREFQPTVVITDQGQNEINAIRAVYPNDVRIFYCAWHVLQAWERKLTLQNLGSVHLSVNERALRKDNIRAQLRQILYTRSEEEANALVDRFRDTWQERAPGLIQYLNKNYLDSEADRRRWMFCFREGVSYAWINTNNYIESWHNTLKEHFFRDKQQRHVDTVIYILVHKAIPHFQQICIRHTVQVGRMTPARRKVLVARLQAMNHIDHRREQDPEVVLLLQTADENVLKVRSFTHPSIFYEVKADWSKGGLGRFDGCTCADFISTKMRCKHIALATIELPYTEFYYEEHWGLSDQSLLMEPSLDPVDLSVPTAPAPVAWTSAELVAHYVQRLSSRIDIMDRERDVTNHEEVLNILRKADELCEKHVPVLSTHNLSNKRARQR